MSWRFFVVVGTASVLLIAAACGDSTFDSSGDDGGADNDASTTDASIVDGAARDAFGPDVGVIDARGPDLSDAMVSVSDAMSPFDAGIILVGDGSVCGSAAECPPATCQTTECIGAHCQAFTDGVGTTCHTTGVCLVNGTCSK